jgi:hypothetical protein
MRIDSKVLDWADATMIEYILLLGVEISLKRICFEDFPDAPSR